MAIKAIIFDCFGVLVLAGAASLRQDYPALVGDLHDLVLRSDYGYISRQEFNQLASSLVGLSAEQFQSRYWAANVRNEPALAWVSAVKKTASYQVGLLSNIGKGWLEDFIPAVESEQLFDTVVLSGEVGMVKPAAEIFELIAQRLGAETYECVMIDDLIENVEAAQRVGMEAILFNTDSQAQAELERLLESDSA